MTVFEYISVGVSIVLALGIGKLLSGITDVFDSGRRDWLHIGWCSLILTMLLMQWAAVWRLNVSDQWNLFQFFVLMLSPMLLYVGAHLLLSNHPETITNWREHLESVNRPVLIVLMVSLINYLFRIHLIVGDLRLNWIAPAILAASLAAYFINRRWAMIVILLLWYVSLANSARVNFWIT